VSQVVALTIDVGGFEHSCDVGRLALSEEVTVPLFMDHHAKVEGLTAQAVAEAHRRDLETQGEYGVNYLKYWFDEKSGQVWCLVEAPDAQAAATVHREAHGLVAEDLTEVQEGV
jgi:Nickel responsive protein SCO4226-like